MEGVGHCHGLWLVEVTNLLGKMAAKTTGTEKVTRNLFQVPLASTRESVRGLVRCTASRLQVPQ